MRTTIISLLVVLVLVVAFLYQNDVREFFFNQSHPIAAPSTIACNANLQWQIKTTNTVSVDTEMGTRNPYQCVTFLLSKDNTLVFGTPCVYQGNSDTKSAWNSAYAEATDLLAGRTPIGAQIGTATLDAAENTAATQCLSDHMTWDKNH